MSESTKSSDSKLVYEEGDLFSAPNNSILVHACNTRGSWGAGIALCFRDRYPTQFEEYKSHCNQYKSTLIGTSLIIPGHNHDIACLFTSRGYGKHKDSPDEILQATRAAVQDLMNKNLKRKPLYACRFNSGKFAVPWEQTEAVLKDLGVAMTICTPPEA